MVRTGASKVEITSPAKCGNWIFKSLTYGKRSRQFGTGTHPLSPGKRGTGEAAERTIMLIERAEVSVTHEPAVFRLQFLRHP
jgi:hypothetical protein